MSIERDIFEDLFVLEMANNHWGSLDRGLRIVHEFSRVARHNNVRAAIKLQFRDVDNFVHQDFQDRQDIRYIKKTMDTKLSRDDLEVLVDAIRQSNCMAMATPFDEQSVDLCMDLNLPIIKVASSDIKDWVLLEKIASAKRPVIVSTGGSSLKDMDDVVTFFANRGLPLALNHCVSLYPSQDQELELNQIDLLAKRYPDVTIGYSSHEQYDWSLSVAIAYAKGARTFERHIDIEADGIPVSPYCTLPDQADTWFRSFHKVKEMSGSSADTKRIPSEREVTYLDALVRGVYAKRELKAGDRLRESDIYLAVPLQKGQISTRELFAGELIVQDVAADAPIMIDNIDSPYNRTDSMRQHIEQRGLDGLVVD